MDTLHEYIIQNYDYFTDKNTEIYKRYFHKIIKDTQSYEYNVMAIYKILFIILYFCG